MTLDEARSALVQRWGEMSGYWGINRTMAEIHALLFASTRPLCTDDVMDQLKISRGNASMNLRALVDWGLIRRAHKPGDRKEHFSADTDIWRMFETIMRERRRREVEPVIATIDRALAGVAEAGRRGAGGTDEARELRTRLTDLRKFLETMGSLFEMVIGFGPGVAKLIAVAAPRRARANPVRTSPGG